MEKSENYKQLLEKLLETIRSDDEDRVKQVLGVIKSNASLDEIASCVETSLRQSSSGRPPDPKAMRELEALRTETRALQGPTSSSSSSSGSTSQRRVMTVEELAGAPRADDPSRRVRSS